MSGTKAVAMKPEELSFKGGPEDDTFMVPSEYRVPFAQNLEKAGPAYYVTTLEDVKRVIGSVSPGSQTFRQAVKFSEGSVLQMPRMSRYTPTKIQPGTEQLGEIEALAARIAKNNEIRGQNNPNPRVDGPALIKPGVRFSNRSPSLIIPRVVYTPDPEDLTGGVVSANGVAVHISAAEEAALISLVMGYCLCILPVEGCSVLFAVATRGNELVSGVLNPIAVPASFFARWRLNLDFSQLSSLDIAQIGFSELACRCTGKPEVYCPILNVNLALRWKGEAVSAAANFDLWARTPYGTMIAEIAVAKDICACISRRGKDKTEPRNVVVRQAHWSSKAEVGIPGVPATVRKSGRDELNEGDDAAYDDL